MKPGTVAFQDQVAATLRDMGQATTGDIRRALPEYEWVFMQRCACRCGELSHQTEHTKEREGSDDQ